MDRSTNQGSEERSRHGYPISLDKLGIAKTAREEKARARNEKIKNDAQYNEKVARLYREVVLKEKAPVAENGFLPLTALAGSNGIAPAPKPEEVEVEEPVSGD